VYTRPFPALLAAIVLVAVPAASQTVTQGAADTPQAPTIEEVQTPPEQVHPVPAHTGWASLVKDTAQDFVAFPKRKSTWTLLAAGAAGALVAHQADRYVESHVVGNNKAENVFTLGQRLGSAYVQAGASVGLWAIGRYVVAPAAGEPRTNKWSHVGFDLMRAQIVSQTLVHAMKYSIRRDRPTGECCAFPSGHATTAFASAAVLERHFGYRGSWPVLAGATYVAASRLVDNRHFLSDVVFGAALGTATGWTVVGIHGRDRYALQPVPVRGGMMIALVRVNE
jgi:membrane-associated phospholipid phosphatase